MKETILDLQKHIDLLLQNVEFPSELHNNIHNRNNEIVESSEDGRVKALCGLYNILNQKETINYFNKIKKRLLLEETNLAILQRLHNTLCKKLNTQEVESKIKEKKTRSSTQARFIAIVLASALIAGSESSSIVQSILSSFSALVSIPNIILIPLQIVVVVAAGIAFYRLELNSLGKPLGIESSNLGKVFKLYARQADLYKKTHLIVLSHIHQTENKHESENLIYLKNAYGEINSIYNNFEEKVYLAETVRSNPSKRKRIFKKICTVIVPCFFGLFAALSAQSLIAYLLPLLIPAIATGPIGLAVTLGVMGIFFALGVIVYLEKKEAVDKFVNKIWGTPSKSITSLIDTVKDIKYFKSIIDSAIKKIASEGNDSRKSKEVEKDTVEINSYGTQPTQSKQEAQDENLWIKDTKETRLSASNYHLNNANNKANEFSINSFPVDHQFTNIIHP